MNKGPHDISHKTLFVKLENLLKLLKLRLGASLVHKGPKAYGQSLSCARVALGIKTNEI